MPNMPAPEWIPARRPIGECSRENRAALNQEILPSLKFRDNVYFPDLRYYSGKFVVMRGFGKWRNLEASCELESAEAAV